MATTFTIDSLSDARGPLLTLSGTRHPDVVSIYVNGVKEGTLFPNGNTWKRSVALSSGINTFVIHAEDSTTVSGTQTVTFEVPESISVTDTVFNPLDEWGLLLNTPRLPGEKNQYYKQRLLHAEASLGGSSYEFLIQGVRRGLSCDQFNSVFTISTKETTEGNSAATGAIVSMSATGLAFVADQLRKDDEALVVDPASREVTLSEEPRTPHSLLLKDEFGRVVPSHRIEWRKDRRTIRVQGEGLGYWATYKYVERVTWTSAPTLSALETAVEALTGAGGAQLFDVTVASGRGTLRSSNLIRPDATSISLDEPLGLNWTYVRLVEADDYDFQTSLLDSDGLYFNTRLESIANGLRGRTRIFLGETVLDRDVLIDSTVDRGFSSLPHLWSPTLFYYRSADPADTTRYTQEEFTAFGGVSPLDGISPLEHRGYIGGDFQSGVSDQFKAFDVKAD